MDTPKILSNPKSSIDWNKIDRDLQFIRSFKLFCKSQKWRIVVSGGYGLDILLGKITRSHNDVDLIIYGQDKREIYINKVKEYLSTNLEKPVVTIKNETFFVEIDINMSGFGANMYYVQTVKNPYDKLNVVIKLNGEQVVNSEKRFPSPVSGQLNNLSVEVQNPNIHLADILVKQRNQTHRSVHDQDISNLRTITDPAIVKEILDLS